MCTIYTTENNTHAIHPLLNPPLFSLRAPAAPWQFGFFESVDDFVEYVDPRKSVLLCVPNKPLCWKIISTHR